MAKDDPQSTPDEKTTAADEAQKSAELAHSNIQRFLNLQAQREGNLIMKAHQQQLVDAAKAAEAASNLAAINIRRFIDLQSSREASLIMRAHQAQEEKGKA